MNSPVQEIAANAPEYFTNYILKIPQGDLMGYLSRQTDRFTEFYWDIPEEKLVYRYADGKWTVKEIVGHLIDTERIMATRALRFARRDNTELPGFDENLYVPPAHFNDRPDDQLLHEFACVRQATICLFSSFGEADWAAIGTANGNRISVEAIGHIIPGHVEHHMEVIRDRYL